MKCSLIICTYKWPEALKLVLSSINSQSEAPNEIIIADDGSGSRTKKTIFDFSVKSNIPIIHSWQEDKGCRIPHSRNLAISKSSYEYIIMIDGDTVLHKDFVKDHKKFAEKGIYIQGSRVLLQQKITDKIFIFGQFLKPRLFFKEAKNSLNMIRIPNNAIFFSYFKSQNIIRIRGCNYSIFKEDILKVNGFNEEFTTWGREDSEFVQRLFNAGLKKIHLKFSGIQYHLYHKERTTNGTNDALFENTIKKKEIWCRLGIDRYL